MTQHQNAGRSATALSLAAICRSAVRSGRRTRSTPVSGHILKLLIGTESVEIRNLNGYCALDWEVGTGATIALCNRTPKLLFLLIRHDVDLDQSPQLDRERGVEFLSPKCAILTSDIPLLQNECKENRAERECSEERVECAEHIAKLAAYFP